MIKKLRKNDIGFFVKSCLRFRGFRGFGRCVLRQAGAWCGLTAGEHAQSFWLIRASRPIHQPCPRTPLSVRTRTSCLLVHEVGWESLLRLGQDRLSAARLLNYCDGLASTPSRPFVKNHVNKRPAKHGAKCGTPWPCPGRRGGRRSKSGDGGQDLLEHIAQISAALLSSKLLNHL